MLFARRSSMSRDSLVIAGATGFVGHAVAQRLATRADRLELVGLTRGRRAVGAWDRLVSCDLFSLKDVERALHGARFALYLVHSMLPSARLVQGRFADLDLICADNFGRAAAKAGVEQIVYLGGLIPELSPDQLSDHLSSRLEVEAALGVHGVPVTTLRAGMVIGPGGSSFEILTRLVRRLPAMVLPRWSEHRCQAIDLETVSALMDYSIGRTETYGQTYDIGGPDALRYREMIQVVGEEIGTPRRTLGVPILTPKLSRLWVSLITGAPRALVAPLIESLEHDMVCRDRRLQEAAKLPGLPFREAVASSLAAERDIAPAKPAAYRRAPAASITGVRSVQRIALPAGRDAEWAAHEYMRWLPHGVSPLLRVEVDDARTCTFFLGKKSKRPLLVLTFARERSASDRQLFYVTGGGLAQKTERGRLEFRVTPDGEHLLTAIHDFLPRLPWWLYRISQALVHRWVMRRFGKHLAAFPSVQPPLAVARAPSSVATIR
ncbi:MAG: NAD-dependent epimerase/dehydratase family protein [Deltaproteobacteria bacterium]|nr:NAD-dependent epimerase/dehydratase family protein [Deltaproteobacteria bacterium]